MGLQDLISVASALTGVDVWGTLEAAGTYALSLHAKDRTIWIYMFFGLTAISLLLLILPTRRRSNAQRFARPSYRYVNQDLRSELALEMEVLQDRLNFVNSMQFSPACEARLAATVLYAPEHIRRQYAEMEQLRA